MEEHAGSDHQVVEVLLVLGGERVKRVVWIRHGVHEGVEASF